MNQVDHVNNYGTPPSMPVKRKRGRPRKDQSLNHKGVVQAPPGFGKVNGSQTHQMNLGEEASDSIVGQAVAGVVEAAFDAGYLLTVKIGNSETSLRGVVFKPGYYIPISSENDVAPHVQMIRRNEVPFPMDAQTRLHGRHARAREGNGQHGNPHGVDTGYMSNGPPPANQGHILASQIADPVSAKGKQVAPVSTPAVASVGLRGNVVPVVLEPVNGSNGLLPANPVPPVPSQASHKAVPDHKQVQTVSSQEPLLQPQTSRQVMPEGAQNDNGPSHQGTVEFLFGEVQLNKSSGVPTPDDVTKRGQFSLQSSEACDEDSIPAGKSSGEDSGFSPEGESDGMSEPLVIEPLQVVRSDVHNPSRDVPKFFDNKAIGRMSELLQALQENMTENQVPAESKSGKNDHGDEETLELNTQL